MEIDVFENIVLFPFFFFSSRSFGFARVLTESDKIAIDYDPRTGNAFVSKHNNPPIILLFLDVST